MVKVKKINNKISDKLDNGITLVKNQSYLLTDQMKKIGAASMAFVMLGSFSGCSSSSKYDDEIITGDTGILDEVSDETLLDNILDLKAYSDLYSGLQFIENDLQYYDDIDLKSIEETLKKINIKEENPYNSQSLETNIISYKTLNDKYKNNELNSDEVHELYAVCETLKKQQSDISNKIATTTWDNVYKIGNLVIKVTFMDAINMKKDNLNDSLESIYIYESSDDSEILTCNVIKSENLSGNYTIKGGTILDNLYDDLNRLNNDKSSITTNNIKQVLNQIKEIIANQFYVSYKDNCLDKMNENNAAYDENCAKAKVLERNK